MNKIITSNIISFFFFTLVQILFFMNFNLYEWGFSFIYIGFILLLPLNISPVLALAIAFTQGISIDIFYNTLGIHAFSTVLLAYLKPTFSKLMIPKMIDDINDLQSISQLGIERTLLLIVSLTFIHHFTLFSFINGFLDYFFSNLLTAFISSLITSFLIFSFVKIFFKNL